MTENKKKVSSLEKKFIIKIPYRVLDEKMDEDFQQLSKTLKVAGFRPGKVPISFVKSKYFNQVLTNVSEKLIREEGNKKFDKEGYKIASQPKVNLLSEFKENIDLEAEFVFEVLPDIELNDFKDIKLEKFVSTVGEEDIKKVIKKLFNDYREFEKIKTERKSSEKDRLIIDFTGYIDDKIFEGGSAKKQIFDVGNNNYLPEFEKNLVGKEINKDVTINLTFPKNYQKKDLQGKKAKFIVKITDIMEPKLLKNEEDLAGKMGLKDKDELKAKIRKELEKYSEDLSFSILKNNIINKIETQYDFPLPITLVNKEQSFLLGNNPNLEKLSNDKKKQVQKKINNEAKKKVKIGLIISEIGLKNKITVTNQELEAEIAKICMQYPGKEKEIIDFYKKNPDRMNSLKGPIFENKVIQHIVEKSEVIKTTISSDELNKKLTKIQESFEK